MAPLDLYKHFFFHILLTFNIEEAGLTATSAIQPTATRVRGSGVDSALSGNFVYC